MLNAFSWMAQSEVRTYRLTHLEQSLRHVVDHDVQIVARASLRQLKRAN